MTNNQHTPQHLDAIINAFNIEGTIATIKPYGSGHINDTFYLKNDNHSCPDYLLQRINHTIFKDVPALMNNVKQVTEHLRRKLASIPGSSPEKQVLTIIPLKNGQLFFKDADGNYWRVYLYLGNTNSYDLVEKELQAFEGGKAFGNFQALLSDLDASLLAETIPDFHNIEMRLTRFYKAWSTDSAGRRDQVIAETDFINKRVDTMKSILNLGKEGHLPLRITHNDTKFNNVLLDANDKAQCVIDLDTVMPGYVAYDFGDAIRTIVNSASEDEKDLSKIKLNIPLFEAYAKGYLSEADKFLSPTEVDSLMMGVLLIPYMQAVRFLTDYLEGDIYYKTNFEGHNLQRTRAQIQLLKEIEAEYETLKGIIEKVHHQIRNKVSLIQ